MEVELKPCCSCGGTSTPQFRHSPLQQSSRVMCWDCYCTAVSVPACNTRAAEAGLVEALRTFMTKPALYSRHMRGRMMKAPDRIWYDPESHTIVLEKKRAMDGDVEYVRNDDDAMREARLVTYEYFEAAKIAASNNYKAHRRILREVMQLKDRLATARNDALEQAAYVAYLHMERAHPDGTPYYAMVSYQMACRNIMEEIRAMKEAADD